MTQILISTCDEFSDVWPITEHCWRTFWPDCPWRINWMSNGLNVPDFADKILVAKQPDRHSWGTSVAEAVEHIDDDIILLWVEEQIPLETVPTDLMIEASQIMEDRDDVGVIHVARYYYRPDRPTIGRFAVVPEKTAGRVNSLIQFWRKDILLRLLKENRFSNEFEQKSSDVFMRLYPEHIVLAPAVPTFRFCDNLVINYKWSKCSANHIKELGLTIKTDRGIYDGSSPHMDGHPA